MSLIAVALLTLLASACGDAEGVAGEPRVGVLDEALVASEGLDPDRISALSDAVATGVYGEVHSLLIMRNGALIHEEYFRGYGREALHVCFSVTKSVASAAVGIAIAQGFIPGVDFNLRSGFPEYPLISNPDLRKDTITLEHLLRMSAGFLWDEWSTGYESPLNDAVRLAQSNDWLGYILDLPMASDPGGVFNYNSGATMLLSGLLQNATGQSTEDFTALNLFAPLGITRWVWDTGPDGITNTGWGLELRPIDMLAIGELYLNEGVYQGRQVIPREWVIASMPAGDPIADGIGLRYGYQWWGATDWSPVVDGMVVNDLYFANGYGGQFIIVIPHLDMVVVMTAGNFDDSFQQIFVIRDFIIPAVVG